MKLHNHFLQLYTQYGSSEEIAITLDEAAAALSCTHRNAVTIIGKMMEHGWISWAPRRGRGRRSMLRFLIQPEEIAVHSMMEAISRRDITRAIDGIRLHTRSSIVKDRLQGWMLTYFGYHSEVKSDRQIDTLRLPVRQQLHTVDPLYMNLLAESFVSSHVFDGLVKRTNRTDDILPGLAHAWEVSPCRTRWTFFLCKEVLFHNGKIMTAEDIVFTFNRLIRTSRRTLYSFIFKGIKSVRALNSVTVCIELEEPNELFLSFLCTSRAAIVPKGLDQAGEFGFGRKPAGTGPFKITAMDDSLCILEAFTPHFQGRAHLDRVEIVHMPWDNQPDPEESISPFHVIHNSASMETAWSQVHSQTSVRKFVTCNTKKTGPVTDPAVRAHILSCLRDDPAELSRDFQTDIPLQIATIPQYKQDADNAARKLGKHGYTITVAAVSPEDFKGSIRLESDLIIFSLLRDQDVQLRLFDLYLTITEHVEPHTRVDIEKRLHAVKMEEDAEARFRLFEKIEERLMRDQLLHILYEKPVQTAYLPSVRGVSFNSQGWVDLRNVWFPPIE